MNEKETKQGVCVSVFKSGDEKTLRAELTKRWAETINRAEKTKRA